MLVNDQYVTSSAPGRAVKQAKPKSIQSEKTIARILDAAGRLFVNKGYHGTSIADIAQEAHLTKGALYCHFTGKSDLLLTLIKKFETEYLDELFNAINAQQGNAIAKLNRLLSFSSDFAEKNRDLCLLLTILSAELQGTGNELEGTFTPIYAKYTRFLHRLIEDGKLQGVIQRDLDTQSLAYVIIAFHDGILLQWQRSKDLLEGPEYVKTFRNTLLYGVQARDLRRD